MKYTLTIPDFIHYLAKVKVGHIINFTFNKEFESKFAIGFIRVLETQALVLGYWDAEDPMLRMWPACPENIDSTSSQYDEQLFNKLATCLIEYGRFDSGNEYIVLCDDETEPIPSYIVADQYVEFPILPNDVLLKAMAKDAKNGSDEDDMPEHKLVFGDVGEPSINCKKCGKPLRWPAPKMTPVYCQSSEYVGSDICFSCMREGVQHVHYYDDNKEEHIEKYKALYFTRGFEQFCHRICLVNSACEETEFEQIPEDIMTWLESIGIGNYGLYPNLVKYWDLGYANPKYAFVFNYEIPHKESDNNTGDDIVLSYEEQLRRIAFEANKIADRIPNAHVCLSEQGAIFNEHNLEIAFMYPCTPVYIESAAKVLKDDFSHVWDIGTIGMEDENM